MRESFTAETRALPLGRLEQTVDGDWLHIGREQPRDTPVTRDISIYPQLVTAFQNLNPSTPLHTLTPDEQDLICWMQEEEFLWLDDGTASFSWGSVVPTIQKTVAVAEDMDLAGTTHFRLVDVEASRPEGIVMGSAYDVHSVVISPVTIQYLPWMDDGSMFAQLLVRVMRTFAEDPDLEQWMLEETGGVPDRVLPFLASGINPAVYALWKLDAATFALPSPRG